MSKKTVPNETLVDFFLSLSEEHDKFDTTEQSTGEILSRRSFINCSSNSLAKTVSDDGTKAQVVLNQMPENDCFKSNKQQVAKNKL